MRAGTSRGSCHGSRRSVEDFLGGRNDLADPFLPHNDRAALNANRRERYHVVAHQKNQSLINPEFGSAVTVISSGGGSLHTEWKIIGS